MDLARTLLIGYGDLAQRLAKRLDGPFTGLRRQPKGLPHCLAADASRPGDLAPVLKRGFDQIVVTLTPSERSDAGYQAAYVTPAQVLVDTLNALGQKPRVVFVSSTSVYGQNRGEWVNEQSSTEPTGFSGRRLLEAEQQLLAADLPLVIARLSGIYGPDRDRLLNQVRAGAISRNLLAYSNRIHVDDAASALLHILSLANPAGCYLVSDNAPVPLAQVVRDLASKMGVAEPESSAGVPFSGKRVDNSLLRASGWQPTYPDWRAGYQDKLSAFK